MGTRTGALASIALAAMLASTAHAQAGNFNVDVGTNGLFPAPSATYGGAANSPGFWNAFSALPGNSSGLLDLLGSPTAVTLSVSGGVGDFEFDDPGTFGDDQQLMDDFGVVLPGNNAVYTFSGLANGSYDVYVNAWVPTGPSIFGIVDVAGGYPCPQDCGGPWTGAHVRDVTYVRENVLVTNNQLAVTVASQPNSGAVCNGIQILGTGLAPTGTVGAAVASFDVSANDADVVQGIARAFGCYWVSGTKNGGAVMLRYETASTHAWIQTIVSAISPGGGSQNLVSGGVAARGASDILVFNDPGPNAVYKWTPGAPGTLTFETSFDASGKGPTWGNTVDVFWTILPNGDIEKISIAPDGTVTVERLLSRPAGLLLVDLAYDYQSHVLWGFSSSSPCGGNTDLVQFIGLDPSTGAPLGPEFFGEVSIPGPNVAIACDLDTPIENPGYFAIAAVQQSTPDYKVVIYNLGVPIPTGPPIFCTSSTTTNGCNPAIGSFGSPSVSALSGFTVVTNNVEGQKQGLIFYGVNNTGYTPAPWSLSSTSFLCVKSPTQRTPVQSSGGTLGQCDGAFAVDLLAYLAANPGALGSPFTAGSHVYLQGWFRDPPAPKTTNLSNALDVTMQP